MKDYSFYPKSLFLDEVQIDFDGSRFPELEDVMLLISFSSRTHDCRNDRHCLGKVQRIVVRWSRGKDMWKME